MSVEFYRGSPGKFDSRTLSRETLSRWTGRISLALAGRRGAVAEAPRMCVSKAPKGSGIGAVGSKNPRAC